MLRNLTTILRLEVSPTVRRKRPRRRGSGEKEKCLPHFLLFYCNFPGLGLVPRTVQAVKEGAEIGQSPAETPPPAVARRTSRNSITLEANARHLLTDVWTSVGVVAGVGMVALTDWEDSIRLWHL